MAIIRPAVTFKYILYYSWLFILLYGALLSSVLASEPCLTDKQQLARIAEWVKVAHVVDGDTLHLQDGRKVRLIGINTPEIGRAGEPSQAFARQAYKTLIQLVKSGDTIGLSYDQDKYDRYKRLLAYVYLDDGRSVERVLLAKGLAHSIVVPPNDMHINCYRAIENKARRAKLGIWQLSEYQWFDAHKLPKKSKGLRFVSGKVSGYSESRKSIYLRLSPRLSIRIAKKDRHYFSDNQFRKLVGKAVSLRGWVSIYKGRQSIHLRSEHDLEL